ncbi:MAG: CRISPR system precrRNA processing endoribonuclease RAMP protein Cas6 [Sphaerochaetaceae bacterium]|nr:CRISPR system precrRNA processing endoribonuclease RAMP protein Cas6 [Spirochaetales bacterium]MDY5500208.1 CRISPR system precrRNA processing endoribonuclease RAMP protein Cas6 [Sphaerochaetaceae bacterium]
MKYIKLEYLLRYDRQVLWRYPAETVFRSVLGMQFRRLCCVLREQESCASCPLRETCVYAWFFESYISADTKVLPGRNRASHPFVIEYDEIDAYHARLSIVFIGKSRNFIPYVTTALERAGEKGISFDRVPFQIEAVVLEGKPYAFSLNSLEAKSRTWPDASIQVLDVPFLLVTFETPFRLQENGRYLTCVTGKQLLVACSRRMEILESLYGDDYSISPVEQYPVSYAFGQRWVDQDYYSSRQKTAMQLGGVKGRLLLKGPFSKETIALLAGGLLFHVGKNVSFGLGRYKIEEGRINA